MSHTEESFTSIEETLETSNERPKAQHDPRTAVLVDGLESRACLSTILAYAMPLEDAQSLLPKLCKKGKVYLDRDPGTLTELCVPRPPK